MESPISIFPKILESNWNFKYWEHCGPITSVQGRKMHGFNYELNWRGYNCNLEDYSAWGDIIHTKEDLLSGGTFIGGVEVVEPSQSSSEDGGWILKNTAHLYCNYLKHFDLFF